MYFAIFLYWWGDDFQITDMGHHQYKNDGEQNQDTVTEKIFFHVFQLLTILMTPL